MKKILAIVLCVILTGACLACLSACGKQDLSQSTYLGTWKATGAKFKGEDVDIKEALTSGDLIITLNGDGTAVIDDADGISNAEWKETGSGIKLKGGSYNTKLTWTGDSFDMSIIGFHLILTAQTGEENTEPEGAGLDENGERHFFINNSPYVITAEDGFDNAGVTELLCDATETYSFTKSYDDTTWKVYVLDEKFADGARYLSQAEEPALEGDGTLEIEEGKYIYILCSESAFTADAASGAALSINYASSLSGNYQDSVSQRATAKVFDNGETLDIIVRWSSSATETTMWDMVCNNEGDKLTYTNCKKSNVTYDENGESTEDVEYENGEGYFTLEDGKLLWNGASEENCAACVFEKTV